MPMHDGLGAKVVRHQDEVILRDYFIEAKFISVIYASLANHVLAIIASSPGI